MKNKTFLDILFENRNKEYGAYQLRQVADYDLMRALFIGVGIVTLITGGTLFANHKNGSTEMVEKEPTVIVDLTKLTPDKPKKTEEVIPPKEETPMEEKTIQAATEQVKYIVPTPTESPKVEETIKSVDELEKADLGTFDRRGEESTNQAGGGEVSETGNHAGNQNTKTPEGPKEIKPVINNNATITSKQEGSLNNGRTKKRSPHESAKFGRGYTQRTIQR